MLSLSDQLRLGLASAILSSAALATPVVAAPCGARSKSCGAKKEHVQGGCGAAPKAGSVPVKQVGCGAAKGCGAAGGCGAH